MKLAVCRTEIIWQLNLYDDLLLSWEKLWSQLQVFVVYGLILGAEVEDARYW